MNIFDFIQQDEIDDLPEDPNAAFMLFVRHVERRLAEFTKQVDENDQSGWQWLQDIRHSFMNIVVAAAKRYGIEPFASLEVPRVENYGADDHRQFRSDLDHYMTQILLDNSIRGKRDSVPLNVKAKDRIRSYLYGIRSSIDRSNIPERKKSSLLAKLSEFEKELDRQRLGILAVARITIEILAIPGALWASADIVQKLVSNVLETVGEAKAIDDELRQLPPVSPPMPLSPPRREVVAAENSFDPNDDIPF